MPLDRLSAVLEGQLQALSQQGKRKGFERVITDVLPAEGERGPRYRLKGDDRAFIRMNSNSYLSLSTHPRIVEAGEQAVRRYGVGPGAVRFISGTLEPHVQLEAALAAFHGREAAQVFSSAYATVLSVLTSLITPETAVISDELNHNCIVNAIRLARPREKQIYPHLNLERLAAALEQASGTSRRAVVVTDGIFSMRGTAAPLRELRDVVEHYDQRFPENVVLVVDDSHGVGGFGATGRGTEEHAGAHADVLIGTLGKAFGVNGGYVVGPDTLIASLRETSPLYIYSNPITPGEASAARAAIELVDSAEGGERIAHLHLMSARFRQGLADLGLETLAGTHPVVPLFVRDAERTTAMIAGLYERGVLATGIFPPVVPKGDESIRFQLNAEHTPHDIATALGQIEAA